MILLYNLETNIASGIILVLFQIQSEAYKGVHFDIIIKSATYDLWKGGE